MRLLTRAGAKRLTWLGAVLVVFGAALWWFGIRMPGRNWSGPPGTAPAGLVAELRRDVEHLAGVIGERHVYAPARLAAAAEWIEGELAAAGHEVRRQVFEVRGVPCANLEVEIPGDDGIVVVGAHYDSVPDCPAANDNGSGVAAVLALARRCVELRPARTLRFVLFVNEEPPWFQTGDMGSLRYARRCRERDERIVAMLSLETIGYFTREAGSQRYPLTPLRLVYGGTGDFVSFVGNLGSRSLVHRAVASFRARAEIPSHGIALFEGVAGVGWSDHWAFWQCGYPAVMVTDTAPFRYPHYHRATDTPDRLRYEEFALVVDALLPVVADLTGSR